MPTGFRNRRILLYDLQKGADSFQQFRSNDDIRSKFIANGKCSEKTCGFIKTVCGTKHSPIGSFPENFGAERRYQTYGFDGNSFCKERKIIFSWKPDRYRPQTNYSNKRTEFR